MNSTRSPGIKHWASAGALALSLAACAHGSDVTSAGAGGGGGAGGHDPGAGGETSSSSSSSTSSGPCESRSCGCTPGASRSCYDGPSGTEGVGPCKAGEQTCDAKGAWGACAGELVPKGDQCIAGECDGQGCPGGTNLHAQAAGSEGMDSAWQVATDAAGDVYVTGYFTTSIDFGCGPLESTSTANDYNGFLVKLSPSLSCIWSVPIKATGASIGRALAVDAQGEAIVTGDFLGVTDFGTASGGWNDFISKFDPDGHVIWTKAFLTDNAGQMVYDTAVDAAGNVFVTGEAFGPPDFGAGPIAVSGPHPMFLAKFDASGELSWAHVYSGQATPFKLAVDASGRVAVTGIYYVSVDFGGGIDLAFGPTDPTSYGEIFVVMFDPAGAPLWGKSFGDGSWGARGSSLRFDATGNLLLGGSFGGTVDFGGGAFVAPPDEESGFLAGFEPRNGHHLFSQPIGGSSSELDDFAITDDGGRVELGYFMGTLDLGGTPLTGPAYGSMFLAKFDREGAHVWSKSYDAQDLAIRALAVDHFGHVFAAGGFSGTVDFGSGPLVSKGAIDYLLAEFAQ